MTGQKIIADTYGGWGGHGGGAFSGKDSTKVDRSAGYAARWIAKSLVFSKLCKRVLVQISYCIGLPEPLSIFVDSFQTVKKGFTDADLSNIVKKNFDLRPGALIKDLTKTVYSMIHSLYRSGSLLLARISLGQGKCRFQARLPLRLA